MDLQTQPDPIDRRLKINIDGISAEYPDPVCFDELTIELSAKLFGSVTEDCFTK